MILEPYWKHGTWCFDDSVRGLHAEPFVSGADKQISYLVKKFGLVNPENGFRITISASWFPDYQVFIEHMAPDKNGSGNFYLLRDGDTRIEGWYCPALLKFFPTAPEKIYCKVESL